MGAIEAIRQNVNFLERALDISVERGDDVCAAYLKLRRGGGFEGHMYLPENSAELTEDEISSGFVPILVEALSDHYDLFPKTSVNYPKLIAAVVEEYQRREFFWAEPLFMALARSRKVDKKAPLIADWCSHFDKIAPIWSAIESLDRRLCSDAPALSPATVPAGHQDDQAAGTVGRHIGDNLV